MAGPCGNDVTERLETVRAFINRGKLRGGHRRFSGEHRGAHLNLEALARLTVLLHLLRGVARIVEDVAKGNVPSELIDHTFIHVCLERLIIHIGV